MGSCLSAESTSTSPPPAAAKVITSNGQLREYPLPAAVSLVLDREAASSPSFFMCNSDGLYYDKFIPVLDFEYELQANQIYFILPTSKLQHRLSAADMAAMAVMASSAIASSTSNDTTAKKTRFIRRYRCRISPVENKQRVSVSSEMSGMGLGLGDDYVFYPPKPEASGEDNKAVAAAVAAKMMKSGSVRRVQRYTSRRAKMAVRSFRLRLTTIYEGATLGR